MNLLTRIRYNTSLNDSGSSDVAIVWSQNDVAIVALRIGNVTKNDNGVEYQVTMTNRFGQYSAITRLNITCNFRPINL